MFGVMVYFVNIEIKSIRECEVEKTFNTNGNWKSLTMKAPDMFNKYNITSDHCLNK